MFTPSDQIGPHTLIRELGSGAFGVVWLAERRTAITTTNVALKMPVSNLVDLSAIRQEAELWVQASGHSNVLPIIEANIYSGQVVIASEYVPDGSLELWLKQYSGKAPSLDSAVEIVSGILAGLEHLHAQHIIHRDLKPANILLQRGTPRIADFGISRLLRSTSSSNIVAGTPAYMAPEAFEGKRSVQTDIWSVGVIFYQLLSGSLPFQGSDMASLMADIITHKPEPLPSTVPLQLQEIVGQLLNKSPSERKSATEMYNALCHASRSIGTTRAIPTVQINPLAEIRRQMLISNSV